MKRLLVLLGYTGIVVGGSYLFRDLPSLPSLLSIGVVVVAFCCIGLLMPGTSGANLRGYGPAADLNYIKAENGETNSGVNSFVSIFSVMYLLVPFFISMYLFVK